METICIRLGILAIIALFVVGAAFTYKKVEPNQVLVIAGGFKRKIKFPGDLEKKVGYRIRIGGGTLITPLFER